MIMKGAEDRAKEVRQAANRLHHEVECLLMYPDSRPLYETQAALAPLAEALGILKNVMEKLDKIIPDDAESPLLGPVKARFASEIAYYVDYHQTLR